MTAEANSLDQQPQSALWMYLTVLHNGRGNALDQQPQGAFLDVLDSATDAFQAGIALTDKVHHVAVVDWVAAAVGRRDVARAVQPALDVLQRGGAYVGHLRRHLQDAQARWGVQSMTWSRLNAYRTGEKLLVASVSAKTPGMHKAALDLARQQGPVPLMSEH